jgi:hypothetical protein
MAAFPRPFSFQVEATDGIAGHELRLPPVSMSGFFGPGPGQKRVDAAPFC